MELFFVRESGRYWRVVDYEGRPVGDLFDRADEARTYALILNRRHSYRRWK